MMDLLTLWVSVSIYLFYDFKFYINLYLVYLSISKARKAHDVFLYFNLHIKVVMAIRVLLLCTTIVNSYGTTETWANMLRD